MHWIDWCIVIIPVLAVFSLAVYSKKFVRGVVDYLAAGRVAGRYVITVGDMTAGLGIITLVALVEANYQTGIAVSFWNIITTPVGILVGLTGFCIYRFRESKALSNGQFLEMRYSRSFRIIASSIRLIAEMLCNSIGPAVAANFFIYFFGLPHKVMIWGYLIPTFAFVVALVLIFAMIIILPGGRISLIITDCIQGLICYPVFIIIAAFIMITFSWSDEIIPVLTNRVPGESFINPFDISKLRDFNVFALIVTIIGLNYNKAAYAGNDNTSAGRTPHEQKMAGILATWRGGFSLLMCTMIALTIITVMNQANFAPLAHEIRHDLSHKVADEVVQSPEMLAKVNNSIKKIPVLVHTSKQGLLSQSNNLDTTYLNATKKALGNSSEGNLLFQKFRSLYNQMMMPMGMRKILPVGVLGVLALLAVMLMITTDDSRIFNASSAIIQDLVVPLRKTQMTAQQHLKYVKWCTGFVAMFFFVGSLFFVQLDYINMFITIMVSIWLGAAGPIMVFGLYSRFGNTIGAYCALIFGSGVAITGALLQRNWADYVYPFLKEYSLVEPIGNFLGTISSPLNPYVLWKMNSVKCPINSYEFWFIAMLFGTTAYIAGSLLTYRKPFNLERMLHRGKYNTDGVENIKSVWTWKSVWSKLIGITPDYSRGDKIIVWSIFIYTFVYQIGLCFVMVIIWNMISPWPNSWWSTYYFVVFFVVTPILGVITTVWFLAGGIIDIKKLFRDLAKRIDNPLDDGSVKGHVSLADVELLGNDEDDD